MTRTSLAIHPRHQNRETRVSAPVPTLPRCQYCGGTVVDTFVGWTHVDQRGVLLGWVCPLPHMRLAVPAEEPPVLPRRDLSPEWVAASRTRPVDGS